MADYNTTFWKIIRWIGVLPIFVVAYFIVYLIVYLGQRFYADPDSWAIKYFVPIFGSLMAGMFSIVYAAKVAPSYKKYVAAILLGLMLMASGLLIYFSIYNEKYVNTLGIVASLVGNIIGFFICKEEINLEEV